MPTARCPGSCPVTSACFAARPPARRRRGRLADRLRRARALLCRGRSGSSGWPGPRAPTPSPVRARVPSPCPRGHRCTAPSSPPRRPCASGTTPIRRPPRPTAFPTTVARPATTAASAPTSAAPSTPRGTRWPCWCGPWPPAVPSSTPETFVSRLCFEGRKATGRGGGRPRRVDTDHRRPPRRRRGRRHRDAAPAAPLRPRPPAGGQVPDDPLPDHRGRDASGADPCRAGPGRHPRARRHDRGRRRHPGRRRRRRPALAARRHGRAQRLGSADHGGPALPLGRTPPPPDAPTRPFASACGRSSCRERTCPTRATGSISIPPSGTPGASRWPGSPTGRAAMSWPPPPTTDRGCGPS